jgi:hypothetical protein
MSAVRNIWADLVDRRLWPVALVLVAALIAVPVLLTKSAPSAPAPTGTAAQPSPLLASPASIGSNPDGGPVGGAFKDPFRQQHVPQGGTPSTVTVAGPGTAGDSGAAAGGSSGDSGSSGGGGGDGGSGSSGGGPKVTTLKVKFGRSGAPRTTRNIAAGTPLPTGTTPYIVYVGQARSGEAEFLVSADAQPQGDGRCTPSKAICSSLFMEPGDTEFFDVTGEKGTVQYQLDVIEVVKP